MKKTVLIRQAGLQEYEGRSFIKEWGQGEGNTLREVVENIIKRDAGRGVYVNFHDDGTVTDWGFQLILRPEGGWQERIVQLQDRVDKLQAALRKYGEHRGSCYVEPWTRLPEDPCTCGLTELLKEPTDG